MERAIELDPSNTRIQEKVIELDEEPNSEDERPKFCKSIEN